MRIKGWMIVWCTALGLTAPAVYGQQESRSQDRLHPHMLRLLKERGPSKGWVFLRDKGVGRGRSLGAALHEGRATLEPRAVERRELRRQRPGLVDIHDVPVRSSYVEAILATGAELSVESRWLNAVSVRGTEAQFRAISELAFVDRVEPVRRGVLLDEARAKRERSGGTEHASTPPAFYGLSGLQLEQLDLIRVHQAGYTAAGVVIGVLDTGFHRGHEAFNQPGHVVDVLAEYDFVDDDNDAGIEAGDPSSQHNHGTWILGTLAAYLPNELVGAAYDASFILAKTEDTTSEYQQEEDFYVAGLEFIEANGGDLATSSLGYIDWYSQSDLDGLTAVTTICVNNATANGMHCVTAAGNSFHDSDPATSALIAPADAFQVITCGAVDSTRTIASFSSDGPSADGRVKPEVLGWGVLTWTVCSDTDTDCTAQLNGTSLSTPLIAGVVACLVDAHPSWSVDHLRRRLFQTGDYFQVNGAPDPLFVLGYGIPNAFRAGLLPPHRRSDTIPPGGVVTKSL